MCRYSLVAVCHVIMYLCLSGANWDLLVYLSVGT